MNKRGNPESLAKARAARRPAPKLIPACHPEERHHGKGLCKRCYERQQAQLRRNQPAIPLPPGTRMADCHPERKHSAKGLCASCYMSRWMRMNPAANSGNQWLANHPEAKREHRRKNHLKHSHGTRIELYALMWAAQGGKCANSGCTFSAPLDVPDFRKGGLHVDHDHATGQVRGLLCSGCNIGLGQLGESLDRILGLAEYIRKAYPV